MTKLILSPATSKSIYWHIVLKMRSDAAKTGRMRAGISAYKLKDWLYTELAETQPKTIIDTTVLGLGVEVEFATEEDMTLFLLRWS